MCGATARIIRNGTTVWMSSIAWNCSSRHLVGGAVPGVAGVVDEDVDLAEGVDRLLDDLVAGARLGQVAGHGDRLALDLAGGLLGDVAVDVVDRHLRALGREQLGGRAPDAPRGAGDDRGLAIE